MSWFKRLFSSNKKKKKQEDVVVATNKLVTKVYEGYKPTDRIDTYNPPRQDYTNDLLDPCNIMSPLNPFSPISIWNSNDDDIRTSSYSSDSSLSYESSISSDNDYSSSSSSDYGSSDSCDTGSSNSYD